MKKVLIGFLCTIIVIALISGCDSKKKEVLEQEARRIVAAENVNPAGVFPFVKEPITLKIMVGQRPDVENMDTNEFTKKMADWGITIEWNSVPSDSVKEKVNIMLATGQDLPDIFMNCGITTEQQLQYGEEGGYFINIEPYLANYAPNVLNMFEKSPLTKMSILVPSGKIFSMGSYEEAYHVKYASKMWINAKELKALNLKMPTTTDEFYKTLVAFKKANTNTIGITGSTKGWEQRILPFLMSPFIEYRKIKGVNENIAFRIENNTIDFSFDQPEWKDGLLWLNKLYKEGLIDSQVFTQDQQQLKTTVNNKENIVSVVAAGTPGAFSSEPIRDQYVSIPPLIGPNGHQFTEYNPIGAKTGHFVITKNCENIEAAIRMMDYFMSEEGTLTASIGREGKEWEYVKDPNLFGINGEPAVYNRMLLFNKQQNVSWSKQAPQYYPDKLRNGMLAIDGNIETRLYIETAEKYAPVSDGSYLLTVVIKEEDVSEYVDIITPLQEYLAEFTSQTISGIIDVEKEWDTYLKVLNSMNYKRLRTIINESYILHYGKIDLWNEN